jgi:hypothetical protein
VVSQNPEKLLSLLTSGRLKLEDFLVACRYDGGDIGEGKISSVLELLEKSALNSPDGKLKPAEALVALELTGGNPGESRFMQGVAFSHALKMYGLGDKQSIVAAEAAFQKIHGKIDFGEFGGPDKKFENIRDASINLALRDSVSLYREIFPFENTAEGFVMAFSNKDSVMHKRQISLREATTISNYLRFQKAVYGSFPKYVGDTYSAAEMLQMAEDVILHGKPQPTLEDLGINPGEVAEAMRLISNQVEAVMNVIGKYIDNPNSVSSASLEELLSMQNYLASKDKLSLEEATLKESVDKDRKSVV